MRLPPTMLACQLRVLILVLFRQPSINFDTLCNSQSDVRTYGRAFSSNHRSVALSRLTFSQVTAPHGKGLNVRRTDCPWRCDAVLAGRVAALIPYLCYSHTAVSSTYLCNSPMLCTSKVRAERHLWASVRSDSSRGENCHAGCLSNFAPEPQIFCFAPKGN